MSSQTDDSGVKVKKVKKVKKVIKKKEETTDELPSVDPEPQKVTESIESSGTQVAVHSEDVVDEAPKKVLKKKIIKKKVIEETSGPDQTASVTHEFGSGQGSAEVQEVVSVEDASTVEAAAPKKKLKKKVVAGDAKSEAMTSESHVTFEAADVEAKQSEKIVIVTDVQSIGDVKIIGDANKVTDVVDSLKDVKKKKIIKKKVIGQPAEEVVEVGGAREEVQTPATLNEGQSDATSKVEEILAEPVLADLPEEIKVHAEDAKLAIDLKSSLENISVESKTEKGDFEEKPTKSIGSDLSTNEFDVKSKEATSVEIDNEITSKDKTISNDELEDQRLLALTLEGMDDDLGVSRSKLTFDRNELDVSSSKLDSSQISEASLSRQKTREMMKELENAILHESSKMTRDPNKVLLSPTMLSMKTLVAREERLQNDLRSIRQSYGNLDAELEHIRHEVSSRGGARHLPSTTSSSGLYSSSSSSSSYKPSTRIVINY